jgi:hypothetical protein
MANSPMAPVTLARARKVQTENSLRPTFMIGQLMPQKKVS